MTGQPVELMAHWHTLSVCHHSSSNRVCVLVKLVRRAGTPQLCCNWWCKNTRPHTMHISHQSCQRGRVSLSCCCCFYVHPIHHTKHEHHHQHLKTSSVSCKIGKIDKHVISLCLLAYRTSAASVQPRRAVTGCRSGGILHAQKVSKVPSLRISASLPMTPINAPATRHVSADAQWQRTHC